MDHCAQVLQSEQVEKTWPANPVTKYTKEEKRNVKLLQLKYSISSETQ